MPKGYWEKCWCENHDKKCTKKVYKDNDFCETCLDECLAD